MCSLYRLLNCFGTVNLIIYIYIYIIKFTVPKQFKRRYKEHTNIVPGPLQNFSPNPGTCLNHYIELHYISTQYQQPQIFTPMWELLDEVFISMFCSFHPDVLKNDISVVGRLVH